MTTKQQYNQILKNSLADNLTDPEEHIIEEMGELIAELSKKRRGRPNECLDELADVKFQIDKFLLKIKLPEEHLMKLSINKTAEKFPHQLKEQIICQ